MSYLIIIDSNQARSTEITKKCQKSLPKIKIYRCLSRDMKTYECFYYQSDSEFFKPSPLPVEPAKLALWHYRDDDKGYKPTISTEISVGFGGLGRESNSNFAYHILSKLDVDNVATVLTNEKIRELWDWACDPSRSENSLPSLIRWFDPALIALQLLCQGYLEVYDNPIVNPKHRDLVNTRDWWLCPFNTIEDLQRYFTHYTKIPNNPIGELIEVIQQSDRSIVANEQKLRQICLQCLKV
ncbi:hypothetical protein [Pseudanabaena sp. UWO310]|uniref:hypothetical protein n=1 Tax=Pseudanabaena sp. UWO310 TaxID=2480795 RepID=UPI00115883CB|nr:hypothetical protein [Pseudanabaena sp. UWO310]TYQ30499.1 hypothetical protein PseudUWO310_08235 [Pseudanabaena sp. UWO310]